MKNLIILLLVLGAGFVVIYNRSQSPEDVDPYESEQYGENTETVTQEEGAQPPAQQAIDPATPPSNDKQNQDKPSPNQPKRSAKEIVAQAEKEKRSKDMVNAIKNFTPEELEEVQQYYREIELEWKGVVKNMLGEKYPEYQKMRREFQRERQESFRKFHFSMMEKHGEDHVYSPTEYEDEIGRSIQEKYFKKIEEQFGPETYNRYMDTLRQFNQEAKRHQDPSKGLLKIFL